MSEPNDTSMQDLKPTVWIGKQGCSGTMIEEIVAQLKKRKLIKVKWLQNTEVDPAAVALQAKARLVEVRGRTMVLADKGRAPTLSTPSKSPVQKATAKATARASVTSRGPSRTDVPARSSVNSSTGRTARSATKPPVKSPAMIQVNEGAAGKRRQTGTLQRGRK